MQEIAQLLDLYDADTGDDGKPEYLTDWLKTYYYVFDEYSPYAEVRASVSNKDDPTMPVDTFRAWFLGIFFVAVFAVLNQVSTHSVITCLFYSFLPFGSHLSVSTRSAFKYLAIPLA